MSAASIYGLESIPFTPTGQPSEDYPYVPPDQFDKLADSLREAASENKHYILLVKGPHGGGKTSILSEIRRRAEDSEFSDPPIEIFSQELLNIDIRDFAADALNEIYGEDHGIGIQQTDTTTLRTRITEGLVEAAEDANLVLWILDEFDIMVDKPEVEQQEFLQFLRDIVDNLGGHPIAFIMSHTVYSGAKFEQHLANMHEPFEDRIFDRFELGYTEEEIKEIVRQRLEAARGEGTYGPYYPFTENAIEELYDLTSTLTEGTGLSDFRTFEKTCYTALRRGGEEGLDELDADFVREQFEEHAQEDTSEADSYSATTRTHIADVRERSVPQQNTAIAQGIAQALSLNDEYEDLSYETRSLGTAGTSQLTVLEVDLSLRGDRDFNIAWFIANPDGTVLPPDDVEAIDELIQKNDDELFANLRVLGFVADIDNDPEFDRVDLVHQLDRESVRGLIGLTAGHESDFEELQQNFNRGVGVDVYEKLGQEVKDITQHVTEARGLLVQTAHVAGYAEQQLTKNTLKERHKALSKKARVQDSLVNAVVQSGFLQENGELTPVIPPSLERLISRLQDGPQSQADVQDIFGTNTDAVVNAAVELGTATNGQTIKITDLDDKKGTAQEQVEELEELLEYDSVSSAALSERAQILVDAFNEIDDNDSLGSQLIVYHAIANVADSLLPKLRELKDEEEDVGEDDGDSADDQQAELGQVSAEGDTDEDESDAGEDDDGDEGEEQPSPEGDDSTEQEPDQESSDEEEEVTVETAIKNILEDNGPLTMSELESELREDGFSGVKNKIMRLIAGDKLKLET